MNSKRSMCVLIICSVLGSGGAGFAAEYTAEALLEVLPYAEKDPFTIGAVEFDKDVQRGFCAMMARLIKHKNTLQRLVERDKIQQTEWFKVFGKTKFVRLEKAVGDLKKNLKAERAAEGSFIDISMTCGDGREAALIVNELLDVFIASQTNKKGDDIRGRLAAFRDSLSRIQRDLSSAERGLEDVRHKSGFVDLEVSTYPHSVIMRTGRLEREKDKLVLEVVKAKATISVLEKKEKDSAAKLEKQRELLAVLQGRLEGLEPMLQEAVQRRRDLVRARIQYRRQQAVRDERLKRLVETKEVIEKLKVLLEDPAVSKVRVVERASVPLGVGV